MNVIPKIELVARRVDGYVILAGVLLTENFSFQSLAGVEMFGRKDGETIRLLVKKEQFTPKNEFGNTFEKHELSSIVLESIWRGFQSIDPNEFGGVMIGRDSNLFEFENKADVCRVAVLSVIQDRENLLEVNNHAMFRSEGCLDLEHGFEFVLHRDTSDTTNGLLETLRGDSLQGFYKKPFYSLADGSKYRLDTDLSFEANAAMKQQYKEIIELGQITPETDQLLRDLWLKVHHDHDFINYVKELSKRTNLGLQRFDRLLTEEEHKIIKDHSKAILNEFMGR